MAIIIGHPDSSKQPSTQPGYKFNRHSYCFEAVLSKK